MPGRVRARRRRGRPPARRPERSDTLDSATTWYVIAGLLLVAMALAGTLLKRLPMTTGLFYLLVGVALGPWGAGLIRVDAVGSAAVVERVTEFAFIVSLFTAGLKLRLPLTDGRWWLPVRLASASMVVTVGLITAIGVWLLGLPVGAAVLMGATLAPTDPVLASDVQVGHPSDRDRLRFGLTGEAGLNDGTAFPFVLLGLGLLGLHDLGAGGWRWWAVDVAWAVVGGLGVGAAAGTVVARLVLYLRRTHKEAVGLDEFLSLGLIALAYGLALLVHGYGFLAVFAAGVALRRVEAGDGSAAADVPADVAGAGAAAGAEGGEDDATHAERAPAYMAGAVLGFNEQLERLCEVAVVVLIGAMLNVRLTPGEAAWFVPLLFLVVRPLAVAVGLLGSRAGPTQRGLIGWFGVRGVGSVYYLAYALRHGVAGELADRLTGLTLTTVAASVVVHGVSVTPLMRWYERRKGRPRGDARA